MTRLRHKLAAPLAIWLFATGAILASPEVVAQSSVWQSSYQLETAGKYAEAIAAISNVPANSNDAEFKLTRLGWLHYLQGDYDGSIREYRLAIERNDRSIDARLGLTLPLLAQKRWREADQMARIVLERTPNNYTALLRLLVAQEGLRDWASMEKTALTLTACYPTDASGFVYLARAYAWLGRPEEARNAYSAVLVRYPNHAEAKAYLEKR